MKGNHEITLKITPSGVKMTSKNQQRNTHGLQWTKHQLLKNLTQSLSTLTPPKVFNQLAGKLRKLRVAETVILLTEIVGYQLEIPRKPPKPELLSKILDIAVPRGE